MHSPMKHQKKTRKNTFSQIAVTQSEVGDFQGGYFVMNDAISTKENDCPYKTRAQNKHLERSPARRKHQNDPTSPHKERTHKFDQELKKPFADMSMDMKRENFRTEQSYPTSPKKVPVSTKQQHMEYHDQRYSSKELSTSPSSAGRWAGPAFGNAPHPSSLPLPEFPPMISTSAAVSTPSQFITQDSYSSTPPGHDGSYLGMVYQSPHHFSLSSSPPSSHLSSIPVVPFPYVGAHQFPQASPASIPSLAQLSTDLRRMLNISGPVPGPIVSDAIMVSANSS